MTVEVALPEEDGVEDWGGDETGNRDVDGTGDWGMDEGDLSSPSAIAGLCGTWVDSPEDPLEELRYVPLTRVTRLHVVVWKPHHEKFEARGWTGGIAVGIWAKPTVKGLVAPLSRQLAWALRYFYYHVFLFVSR
jgi:hypothetical protein